MLAEENDLNILSLMINSCLQAEVLQIPALNKHKQRVCLEQFPCKKLMLYKTWKPLKE
jgi:hypothetical protein